MGLWFIHFKWVFLDFDAKFGVKFSKKEIYML